MEKRYQVFVSSTYIDLKDERQKVIQTLMEMDCIPSVMELFPSIDDEQWEFIKKVIDDCDYYLLIIGGRYGSPSPEGINYTEKEFDYAVKKGIKVIALLHGEPDSLPVSKTDKNPDFYEKLKQFRAKVETGRLVKYWKETEEIAGIVALSLQKTIKTYPAIGWVRADKVSNEELLTEINELRKQNAELTKALADIEPSIFTGSEKKDFSYIYEKLNRFENVEIVIDVFEESVQNINPYDKKVESKVENYSINLASLVPFVSTPNCHEYKWIYISRLIVYQQFPENPGNIRISIKEIKNLASELIKYAFIMKNYVPPIPKTGDKITDFRNNKSDTYLLCYSEKLERYKYWLDVTGRMPEQIEIIKNN